MRETAIDCDVVSFIEQRDSYSRRRYGSEKELSHLPVPLDLLKIAIFLDMETGELEELEQLEGFDIDLKLIEERLIGNNAEFIDEGEKLVKITGYDTSLLKGGDTEENTREGIYIKSLLCYLILEEENTIKRNEFLWMSLLFPFIKKMNSYVDIKQVADKLRQIYPLEMIDGLKSLETKEAAEEVKKRYRQIISEGQRQLGLRWKSDCFETDVLDAFSMIQRSDKRGKDNEKLERSNRE